MTEKSLDLHALTVVATMTGLAVSPGFLGGCQGSSSQGGSPSAGTPSTVDAGDTQGNASAGSADPGGGEGGGGAGGAGVGGGGEGARGGGADVSGQSGSSTQPADGGVDGLAAQSSGDPCSTLPCKMHTPDLTKAVDLDTFQVPDDPQWDRLVPSVAQIAGHITVPPSLSEARLRPCRFPVRMDGLAALTPTVDGDLADWSGVKPVAIDREGDLSESPDYDLLRVYHAEDSGAHYFAFSFKANWPDGDPAVLQMAFAHLTFPRSGTESPGFAPSRLIALLNNGLVDASAATISALPAGSFAIAGKGRTLEMRIAREQIEGKIGQGPWTLTASVSTTSSAKTLLMGKNADIAGAVWSGLAIDYGCLVPTAKSRVKLFVFRHADGVDPEQAEVVNRAAIAAAPWVEKETDDTYDYVDTVDVTTVMDMTAAGLHSGPDGIFVAAREAENLLTTTGLGGRFQVVAHEYAHGLNSDEYDLPARWLREGHSEMISYRATEAALGTGAAQYLRFLAGDTFTLGEDASSGVSLAAEPWPQPNKTMQFDYSKSALFSELLTTVLPDAALRRLYRKAKSDGIPYANGTAFLTAVTAQPEFVGKVSSSMWNGWFGGSYEGSLFARASVQADADHDGLLDYQESLLGLDSTHRDTDRDGMTDTFELAAGTDPKTSDPLRSLVMDGSLDDWDKLAPTLLQRPTTTKASLPQCSGVPSLVRAGVVFDGEWLAAGVELSQAPTDPTFTLAVIFTDDSGKIWELLLETRTPTLVAYSGSEMTMPAVTMAPLTGTQAEFFYRADAFGWNSALPSSLRAHIGIFVGSGTGEQCEISQALSITRTVP